MTTTDERYEKILKSLESAGMDFDEFGDIDKGDLDRNFSVPSVKPERKAPAEEEWDADVISLSDLQKLRDEDEAGVQAKKFTPERKATEDWDDVISMDDLIRLQNEDSGNFSGKKFDGNSKESMEDDVLDAAYQDMMMKKNDLDRNPTMPHQGQAWQRDGEGDGYEEPYGALMEPVEDEEDGETFTFEAFKEGDLADENPEFKFDGNAKGIVNANEDMEGINSRKFWDEAIATDEEEQVEVGYNPSPNAELDMPRADFKKKFPKDDLEGIESKASEYSAIDYFTINDDYDDEIICDLCNKRWDNQYFGASDADNHLKSEHGIVASESKTSEAEVECAHCNGTGYHGDEKCERCDGTGKVDPKYSYLFEEESKEADNMLLKIQDGDIHKLDSWEEEGSMGDIWTCPECGFKSASKDEYDDHSNAHGMTESFNFEDLGKDEDILEKFRND